MFQVNRDSQYDPSSKVVQYGNLMDFALGVQNKLTSIMIVPACNQQIQQARQVQIESCQVPY